MKMRPETLPASRKSWGIPRGTDDIVNRRETKFAAGRSKAGAGFIVHSCYEGRGEATPLPSDALQPLTNPTANRYPQKPLSAFPYLAISFRLRTVMP